MQFKQVLIFSWKYVNENKTVIHKPYHVMIYFDKKRTKILFNYLKDTLLVRTSQMIEFVFELFLKNTITISLMKWN